MRIVKVRMMRTESMVRRAVDMGFVVDIFGDVLFVSSSSLDGVFSLLESMIWDFE